MLNRRKNFLWSILMVALLVAACGDTGSKNSTVPNAGNDPTNPGGQTDIDPNGNPTNGIPDLTKAQVLSLFDKVNYSGLAEISGNVFPPVVGDTKILLQVSNSRSSSIDGKVLFAFEDAKGFWGARMNSVKYTGTIQTTYFDMIFTDDVMTVRTYGTRSSDNISATFYYRMRASGENQCKPVTLGCTLNGSPVDLSYCYANPAQAQQNQDLTTASQCQTYITPGGANVKGLGTFNVKYSEISVLN